MGSEAEKANAIWTLLPSFDPGQDDVKEYIAKVKFLDGICPKKDRGMLAPRLAMLCKGTAWHQVRSIDPDKLTNPDHGVKTLLEALSAWEDSAELKTFELFEKAIYKTIQKADESAQSFVNRLDVAFGEVGHETTLKSVMAFVLLKQSNLTTEDKKKILTMTGGKIEKKAIEGAMRSLSTNVLTSNGSEKKKVYPTNLVEDAPDSAAEQLDQYFDQSVFASQVEEEDISSEFLDQLATSGDADALTVQGFERELTDPFQEIPDLHSALVSYQEARGRIVERKRNRGFWPLKGGSTGKGKGFGNKGFRKGQSKGKDELLARIARTHCKRCGELGHWKAECPLKMTKESQANVASASHEAEENDLFEQVLIEEINSDFEVGSETGNNDQTAFCQAKQFEVGETESQNQSLFEPEAHANFSEAVFERAKIFFSKRNQNSIAPIRKSQKQPLDHPTAVPEHGLTSKAGQSEGFKTNGMAIIDTGASRVAFRFGNNQVEHSYKQIHVPIEQDKVRIWLIVEVVPKATPFLLSIQTMKRLGMILDLQKGSCFLKVLNKSVTLHEGKTGLLMICIQDLCRNSTECQSIFGASSRDKPDSFFVESYANSRRDAPNGQRDCRTCRSESADIADDSVEPSGNPSLHTGGADRTGDDDERTPQRGPIPEGEDRRDRIDHEAGHVAQSQGRTILSPDGERPRSLGAGGAGVSSPNTTSTSASSAKDDNESIHSAKNKVCGSRKGKLPSPDVTKSSRFKPGWDGSPWKPIADEPITRPEKPAINIKSGAESCMDDNCNGSLGPKDDYLGKEKSRKDLCHGLRSRSSIRELVPEQDQFVGSSDQRFCPLLPNPSADGGAVAPEPTDVKWETLILDASIAVENIQEAKLLKASEFGKTQSFGKQVDLLEVYAQPNSRLAEEVGKHRGIAVRFTRDHGDLSTFEGQVHLLRMICRLRPKHIWVAPECFPWCAWNRFNATQSSRLYERIQRDKNLSKEHLVLCALICKIQVQNGRHFTMENPGTSDMWKQEELDVVMRLTKTVHLDQCRFGLVHPEDDRPLKKHTRLQTTSNQIVRDLDGRRCQQNHEHSQIAGSCKFQGQRMALSRFAAFYPRVLARAAAKSILQEKKQPEVIAFVGETIEDTCPVDEDHPAKRARFEPPREPKRKAEPEETVKTPLHGQPWDETFQWLQSNLPKSGSVDVSPSSWPGSFLVEHCGFHVKQILAGKGMDKYLVGQSTNPIRKTICQCRRTK